MVNRPPKLVRAFMGDYHWNMNTNDKDVFLTFDDGPTPRVTNMVLDILDEFKARATFFCIGRNVEKNPELYREIINRGHQTGNHTYSHLNGIKSKNDLYFKDIKLADSLVKSNLFRPPYGRIRRSQGKYLHRHFKIIMWDVLSFDYSQKTSAEKCLNNVLLRTTKGSIVVFHDSQKTYKKLEYILPKALSSMTEKGYNFKSIIIN